MAQGQHLHWGAEALWEALSPLLPGLSVEVVARVRKQLYVRRKADK